MTDVQNNENMCLQIVDLNVETYLKSRSYPILQNVSFSIKNGQSIAFIGSSGCGKTITALSILNLLPKNFHCQFGDYIFENNRLKHPDIEVEALRGQKISMIFQDPVSALNPVIKVGQQLNDVISTHLNLNAAQSKNMALDYLREAGFAEPEQLYLSYPHHLSGGMAQRVMIAMALSCQPSLIIADEPTTALDTITQNHVLRLLKELQEKIQFSLLLISHDINLVSAIVDDIFIMKSGQIIEHGSYEYLVNQSGNSYTQALLQTISTY